MTIPNSSRYDSRVFAWSVERSNRKVLNVLARNSDVYQGGFIDKDEFESRVSQVNRRLAELQADLESLKRENKYVGASRSLSARLYNFTSAITHRLDTMTFHERQTLVRSVLEEVVINDNIVKLYLKIPVPKPNPNPPGTPSPCVDQPMSTQFDLRSRAGARWRLS